MSLAEIKDVDIENLKKRLMIQIGESVVQKVMLQILSILF